MVDRVETVNNSAGPGHAASRDPRGSELRGVAVVQLWRESERLFVRETIASELVRLLCPAVPQLSRCSTLPRTVPSMFFPRGSDSLRVPTILTPACDTAETVMRIPHRRRCSFCITPQHYQTRRHANGAFRRVSGVPDEAHRSPHSAEDVAAGGRESVGYPAVASLPHGNGRTLRERGRAPALRHALPKASQLLRLAILLVLVACGSTEPADAVTGSYALATMDGQPLPHVQTVSDVTLTITDGLLVISPKGEWSMATTYTRRIGTQPASTNVEIVTGTWHAEGSTVTLVSSNPPDVRTATYAAGTLTLNSSVYRKQ